MIISCLSFPITSNVFPLCVCVFTVKVAFARSPLNASHFLLFPRDFEILSLISGLTLICMPLFSVVFVDSNLAFERFSFVVPLFPMSVFCSDILCLLVHFRFSKYQPLKKGGFPPFFSLFRLVLWFFSVARHVYGVSESCIYIHAPSLVHCYLLFLSSLCILWVCFASIASNLPSSCLASIRRIQLSIFQVKSQCAGSMFISMSCQSNTLVGPQWMNRPQSISENPASTKALCSVISQ